MEDKGSPEYGKDEIARARARIEKDPIKFYDIIFSADNLNPEIARAVSKITGLEPGLFRYLNLLVRGIKNYRSGAATKPADDVKEYEDRIGKLEEEVRKLREELGEPESE